ncbi:MAG: hypothetical protein JRM99_01520 [Nitrososphaerota archaeon]|nr:hypothetical protein [Nitrososphaerota archaeon]
MNIINQGNWTIKNGAIGIEVPLPGGYNDPTISGYQIITYRVGGGSILFETEAYGTFNYQSTSPYYITGVGPTGSGQWVWNSWAVCIHQTIVGPTGVTISYVQQDAGAAAPLCPFTTAVEMYPEVQFNSISGQLSYATNPYNSWVAFACQCTGVSWSFPAP